MGLSVDFTKAIAKIQELSKKASKEVLDKALDEGEKPVLKAMIRNVNKDTHELQNSLGEIKKKGTGLKRVGVLGIKSEDRSVIERGYYNEYGTCCIIGTKWMKRSFDEAKGEANEAIKKSLIESLKV